MLVGLGGQGLKNASSIAYTNYIVSLNGSSVFCLFIYLFQTKMNHELVIMFIFTFGVSYLGFIYEDSIISHHYNYQKLLKAML